MSLGRKTQQTAKRISLSSFRFLCQAALLLLLGIMTGKSAPVSETEVKAAFLYNFAKFVEWPVEAFSSDTAPIQLGVFGDEEFTAKLKSLLSDKKAHGRSFEVKRLSTPQEAKNVQIVFVTNPKTNVRLKFWRRRRSY